jgi:Fic family protein
MHRPPQLPTILSTRQSYQWIHRLQQKFQALSGLSLSPQQQRQLNIWLEVEFVGSTLRLEGIEASRTLLLQAVQAMPKEQEAGELPLLEKLLRALREIEKIVEEQGQEARLSAALLKQLNGDEGFRKTNSSASSVRAEHLPMIVENACRWFAMDSFAELNPVEQSAIALLRLTEIAPFEGGNGRTSMLAASLFTMRCQLPPLIFRPEQREAYLAALREGSRMNTQPMVELLAQSVEQTLDEMLQQARA